MQPFHSESNACDKFNVHCNSGETVTPIALCQDSVADEIMAHDEDDVIKVAGQYDIVHENMNNDGHSNVTADENYFSHDFRGDCENGAGENVTSDVNDDVMDENQGDCEESANADDDDDDEFFNNCQNNGNENAKDDLII